MSTSATELVAAKLFQNQALPPRLQCSDALLPTAIPALRRIARTRREVLTALETIKHGWISICEAWMPAVREVECDMVPCRCCDDFARLRRTSTASGEVRRVLRCWNCGASSDQLEGEDPVVVEWQDGFSAIRITAPQGSAMAAVLVSGKALAERYSVHRLPRAALRRGSICIDTSSFGALMGSVTISVICLRRSGFGISSLRHYYPPVSA